MTNIEEQFRNTYKDWLLGDLDFYDKGYGRETISLL